MATYDQHGEPVEPESTGIDTLPPPRMRLPLKTAENVRTELARLYREGKAGKRAVADVSRLANVLATLGRLIETGDLEQRIERLEGAR